MLIHYYNRNSERTK